MPKIPGIKHLDAIRALGKVGFSVKRQGKHVIMTDGDRVVIIPRNTPINSYTMASIAKDAGLSVDEFLKLL